jgi:hypothetical protein
MTSKLFASLTVEKETIRVDTYPGKAVENRMEDKQKVTLYLPPQLHRQLKIRSAVDADSMSNIVEKAVEFYLHHSDVVEGVEVHGSTHQVYHCPECEHPVVVRDGELVALGKQPGVITDERANLRADEIGASVPAQSRPDLATVI